MALLDPAQSAFLVGQARRFFDFLRQSYSSDEKEWEPGIYIVIADLRSAIAIDPNNLEARRMLVEMIGDQLGAFEEALEEANQLALRAPEQAAVLILRDRIRARATSASVRRSRPPNLPE